MEDRYIKDPTSGAIINTDYNQYEKIIAERNQLKKQIEKDLEMDKLRAEMAELKQILQGLNV